jgi:cellulose biosynthesis protein BcsQ
MKVITFSIFKGGTGKTTSAVNTAAALAEVDPISWTGGRLN